MKREPHSTYGIIQERTPFCKKVITQTSSNKNKLCFSVNLNNSDSLPANPTAAQAIAIDWGEIIFPVTPPDEFAANARTGSIPTLSAVTFCRLPNKRLADVSDPVMNTPSQPRTGAKNGNKSPDFARVIPNVVDMPEAFVT